MLEYNKLKNIIIDNNVNTIEVRFDYKQHINFHKFHILMNYLNKYNINGIQEISTMYYGKYIKNSVLGVDTLYKKKQINKYYNQDYDVEIIIVNNNTIRKNKLYTYDTIRDKIKYIYKYQIGNAIYTIELSEIINHTKKYEIELKYIHSDFLRITTEEVDVINAVIHDLLLKLNQTDILYSLTIKNQLLTDYTPYHRKCRFINFDDIGVPSVQSIKGKGKKKSLVIHHTGIWLINQPYEYNLIIDPVDDLTNLLIAWSTTVYEGVLIKPIKRDSINFNYKYWFLCNDCSVIRGKEVALDDYKIRFEYMKEFKNRITFFISEDYVTFSLQTIRYSDTPDKFHQNCRELLSLAEEINYDSDGLIITPIYLPEKIKWMDVSNVNIDFIAYNNKMYVIDNDKEIEFKGTEKYPFHGVKDDFVINNDRTIVSCKWNNDITCINRLDKETGDNMIKAIENWNYIHNPINIETIKGNDMIIVYNYIYNIFNKFTSKHDGIVINNLSKYWKNEESLDKLVDYLVTHMKMNDKFLFLTLCGDAITHMFHLNTVSFSIGNITIINNKNRTIDIIDNNIITEYLVHLSDLTEKLKQYNIFLMEYTHINNDNLLTTEGNIYSSLYAYGYYIKT